MIKSMMKFRILFVLALLFQLVAVPLHSSAAVADTSAPTWIAPIEYLALGDSLAAGLNSANELGEGYTDYLAQALKEMNLLKSFDKNFAQPGYKTTDVLADLKKESLQKSIATANLITISAGANDALANLGINTETGAATIDLVNLMVTIKQVGVNYNLMLKEIYAINPDVQVYVMGYYNPFPHKFPELQTQLGQLLVGLNGAIQTGMTGTNAVFVPTAEKIAANYTAYLPNPDNIHLSEAGYKLVTEQFANQIKGNYQWIPKNTFTAEVKDATTVKLNWKSAADNEAVVGYSIYNGTEKVGTVAGDVYTYNVEKLSGNKAYTFTVVAVDAAKNVSVLNPTVTITTGETEEKPEIPEVPAVFPDISTSEFKVFIEQAVALGLINGHKDGTFKPKDQLTRVQAAAIIVRALGLKSDEAAPFADIASYAAETQAEIAAAYKFKIVQGSDGNFMPSKPVTRAQLALMIKRTYEMVSKQPYVATELAPFSDIGNYDAETKNAISMLYELKIASGSNGKYMPSDATTRGQASKIFVNFVGLAK